MGKEHLKEMSDEHLAVTIEHKDEIIVDMLVVLWESSGLNLMNVKEDLTSMAWDCFLS